MQALRRQLVLMFLVGLSVSNARADIVLSPADYGTFRMQPGGPGFFDNFVGAASYPSLSVEDRGVIEFSIAAINSPVTSATLRLVLTRNDGSTSIPLNYRVFTFVGDGNVSLSTISSDYSAGTLANNFTITNQAVGTVISIDVTAAVAAFVAADNNFAGFNVRFNGSEPPTSRFTWLSGLSGANSPVLQIVTVVPEARAWLAVGLLAIGGGAVRWRQRNRRHVACS
jgi:hypothetical protein